MDPNFARSSKDFCRCVPVGRVFRLMSSRDISGRISSRGRVYSVVDPNLEALPRGHWDWRKLRNNTLLGGFSFNKTTVLVVRVAAADYRSITALGGADKAVEKSDRQCWGFLEELFLQVRNPYWRPIVHRMGSRNLASNQSDIFEPFFGSADSSICFRMRLMWNAKKISKQVDKCT